MSVAESTVLGGLLLTSTALHDLRSHERRIKIGRLSTIPGRFFAPASASVATAEDCISRGSISPAVETVYASVFAYPSRVERAPQNPWLQRRPSHSRPLYQGVLHRGDGFPRDHGFDGVRLCRAWHSSPSVSDDAPTNSDSNRQCTPAVEYGSTPDGAPRQSSRSVNSPPRVPWPRSTPSPAVTPAPAASPVPMVPTDRDLPEPIGTSILRPPSTPGDTPTALTMSDAFDDIDELQFDDSVRDFRLPTGNENTRLGRHAMPKCPTPLLAGRQLSHPTSCHATLRTSVPSFRTPRI